MYKILCQIYMDYSVTVRRHHLILFSDKKINHIEHKIQTLYKSATMPTETNIKHCTTYTEDVKKVKSGV